MKSNFLMISGLFIMFCSSGQTARSQYIGINIIQLSALTLNTNYSIELNPFFTSYLEGGYAFNYEKSYDLIGFFLTPHAKCGNCGYELEKRTGGYLKVGTYFNLRKSFEKQNFFHLGIFFNNSFVHESGDYITYSGSATIAQPISHNLYIPGISISGGYEFTFFKILKSNIDFQVSIPNKNYLEMYGYRNYIPGMGFKDFPDKWFPMVIWNLKYRL